MAEAKENGDPAQESDFKGVAKLIDFSLCVALPPGESQLEVDTIVKTTGYMDRDYLTSGIITEKVDVYMFGIVLLELLAGRGLSQVDHKYIPLVEYVQNHENVLSKILDPIILEERGEIEHQLQAFWRLALRFDDINYGNCNFVEFFDSLPALHKLYMDFYFMLTMSQENTDASPVLDFLKVQDYSNVLLNQLQEVKVLSITGAISKMTLTKLLLEKSPKLKRMVIQHKSNLFCLAPRKLM
ncbi:unnamed protein product [Fraxinus pennsylvanica]|uniref:Protein kinase domain-containing protein n=1 Tax=Fraxinus pennsylvanica TaxID=56036 RepID=A0AAD2A711_9LAMI|nr:unnamed protein product [Fraxinus pennsylvanica]